eukprot:276008-Prymnesium_polylepis.1
MKIPASQIQHQPYNFISIGPTCAQAIRRHPGFEPYHPLTTHPPFPLPPRRTSGRRWRRARPLERPME